MFCPRCGTENDDENRFCVSCGSSLSEQPADKSAADVSLRGRLEALLGTTRRARLLTAATVAAIVVAVLAFIALKPSEDSDAGDAYLQKVDQSCVGEKERVSQLEQETLQQAPPDIAAFASVLTTIVAEWRMNLQTPPPPRIHAVGVEELDSTLREVLIDAGALTRLAREGGPAAAIAAQAAAIDRATAAADRAMENLGLDGCADLSVGPAANSGP